MALQITRWMLFLFLFGVGMMVVGIHMVRKEVGAMITWPRVDAVVVSSRVVEGTSTSTTVYSPGLKLKYTVAGKEYIRDAEMSGWATTSQMSSEEIVDEHPPGSHHMVPYNPADPNEVRLQLGGYLDTFSGPSIFLLIGCACMLPVLLTALNARKTQKS